MRQPSNERLALMRAAQALHAQGRPATLRELAQAAQVPLACARYAVPNLLRAGVLQIAGLCRVGYCNRPVAQYRPAIAGAGASTTASAAQALGHVFQTWASQKGG